MRASATYYREQFMQGLFIVLLASIAFSLRAVTSISIFLLLGISIYEHFNSINRKDPKTGMLIVLAAMYLAWETVSVFQSPAREPGVRHLIKISGLVFLPMLVYFNSKRLAVNFHRLGWVFCFFLVSAALICLFQAVIEWWRSSSTNVFFYHDLVQPAGGHAIRFSMLVYFALVFLLYDKGRSPYASPALKWSMVVFFSLFLFLLSSKLVLAFYICTLIPLLFRKQHTRRNLIAALGLTTIVLIISFTSNPVSNRFRQLFSGDQELFKREHFDQGIYFNGFQFRLLQWRLVPEILTREKAWVTGVSAGSAQELLNAEYIKKNMYTGRPGTTDRGLLDYHTHNQFLQSLLQNGIPGLLVMLAIYLQMMRIAFSVRSLSCRLMVVLLFLYSFTDAVIETQYGIVLFCFFPLFYYISYRFKEGTKSNPGGNPLLQTAFLQKSKA